MVNFTVFSFHCLLCLMKWKVKSSTLFYGVQYSTQCALGNFLQNLKGYAEKFSEKICIL